MNFHNNISFFPNNNKIVHLIQKKKIHIYNYIHTFYSISENAIIIIIVIFYRLANYSSVYLNVAHIFFLLFTSDTYFVSVHYYNTVSVSNY